MKRKVFVTALMLLLGGLAMGEIQGLQFEPKEFDENAYVLGVYDNMKRVDVKTLDSQSYDYAFMDKTSRYEIRYTLFAQTGSIKDYKVQVAMWAMIVVQNIAGDETSVQNSSAFKDDDVKKEFNDDYGLTSFVLGGKSDFTQGYKYVMINFFYKQPLGIVCQAILFNDIEWTKTMDFINEFHSFRYK